MRLTVLGSGSAFSTCGCNAGYLVDGRVLVDCGAPVPALALVKAPADLDRAIRLSRLITAAATALCALAAYLLGGHVCRRCHNDHTLMSSLPQPRQTKTVARPT